MSEIEPTLCGLPIKFTDKLPSELHTTAYKLGSLDSYVLVGIICERGHKFTITKEKLKELAGCPLCKEEGR